MYTVKGNSLLTIASLSQPAPLPILDSYTHSLHGYYVGGIVEQMNVDQVI